MTENEQHALDQARAFAAREPRFFVNGAFATPQTSDTIDVLEPSSGETIGQIADASVEDVDAAVTAARKAFESPDWADMTPNVRRDLMLQIADLVDQNRDELAYIEAMDTGKTLRQVRDGELRGVASTFRYFAGWCDKIRGSTHQVSMPGQNQALVLREPIGVAALIVPWNFPIAILAMKLAPALAAGCTTIIKPAEDTSLSALRFAEILVEAGVPAGVVNILTGLGSNVGAALAKHGQIDKVSFTGSTQTGKTIVQLASSNLKRLGLELGGKSPNIILPDANLDKAISVAATGAFANCGQNCIALSRILVHEDVHDHVVDGLCTAAAEIKVGGSFEADVDMGSLVSVRHRERVSGYVETAQTEGAQIVFGGKALERSGFFFQPTVIDGATDEMTVVKEEVFGPVVSVETFSDVDAIIPKINHSQYGLSGSVWTGNLSTALKLAKSLRVGVLGINAMSAAGHDLPFGGYRQSGWGREQGFEAVDGYLETKSVLVSGI